MNKSTIQLILNQLNIKPKKYLGQNFIIDKNVVDKIISVSNLKREDVVLEIGPGLGFLTESLIKKVKKVHAVEIDSRLCDYLEKKFSKYNNLQLVNDDLLKIEIPLCNKVVSNIPYSITGPILEKVFFNEKPPQGILIIEKSLSDRLFNKNNYKKFSRITLSVNAFMRPIERFNISPKSFYPIPNIELSLINLIPREKIDPFLMNSVKKNFFLEFIAGIMPFKNKNLINAIELFYKKRRELNIKKEEILRYIQDNNFGNEKVSQLKVLDFIELSKIFYNY